MTPWNSHILGLGNNASLHKNYSYHWSKWKDILPIVYNVTNME